MLVICFTPSPPENLGGYGDRILGLISVRLLSKALGRKFYIQWTKENIKPCINYTAYDYELVTPKSDYQSIYHLIDNQYRLREYLQTSTVFFESDVTLFYLNDDIAQYLYKNPLYAHLDYTKDILAEYRSLYTDILVPTESLMDKINAYTTGKENIIGIQVRCGDFYIGNAREPYRLDQVVNKAQELFTAIKTRCSTKYDKYSIFLTTDYDGLYATAASVWDPSQIIYNNDPVQHIDRPVGGDISKLFIDSYILSQCTVELYISDYSNFGRVAALSCVHSNIYNLKCAPINRLNLTSKRERLVFSSPRAGTIPGVTFVTALYLPSNPIFKSVDKYFEHFKQVAATGISLIVYLDWRLVDRGIELCREFPNIIHCEYGSLDTSWVQIDIQLPYNRRAEKDTVDYFCIQLSKLGLLRDAGAYAKSTHVAWIDFGISHIFKNPEQTTESLKRIANARFPTNTILAPGCWPVGKYDVWNSICWRFCGGFLVGTVERFAAAAERQMYLVNANLPGLTWEVNYWAMMEDLFTNYDSEGHDDSMITNVCQFIVDEQKN